MDFYTDNYNTIAPEKVVLLNWGINVRRIVFDLTGYTKGHKRLPDGTSLGRTSGVLKIVIDYDAREVLFRTRNTLYSGSFDDYNPEYLEECREAWDPELIEQKRIQLENPPKKEEDADFDDFFSFDNSDFQAALFNTTIQSHKVFDDLIKKLTNKRCKLYKLVNRDTKKAESAAKKLVRKQEKELKNRIETAKTKLEKDDIYLDIGDGHSYNFGFAIHGSTGEVITEPRIHLATYGRDSVLVFNHYIREDGTDLRYFPEYDNICFYNDLYNMQNQGLSGRLILHNSGPSDFGVEFTNGERIILAPDEERVFHSK